MATLFPDNVLKKAREAINNIECKGHSNSSSHKKGCYHPYESQEEGHDSKQETSWLGRISDTVAMERKKWASQVTAPQARLLYK